MVKRRAAKKESGRDGFLSTAPAALIRHHGRISNGQQLLGRLLTSPGMNSAWGLLSKYVEGKDWPSSYYANPYMQLWSAIIRIRQASRAPRKTQKQIDDELKEIQGYAQKLRDAIVDPDREGRRPRNLPPKTGARFDYPRVHEYFPDDVMKINMRAISLQDDAWEKAAGNGPVRAAIADRLLTIWPQLSEVLDQLIDNIRRERGREKAAVSYVLRRRKKKSGDDLTPERFFVIGVVTDLKQRFGVERQTAIAIAASIAAAISGEHITTEFVTKAMRGR